MSVPLRRNRTNGIRVKVIAVVINKTRRRSRVGGASNRFVRLSQPSDHSWLCVIASSMHRQLRLCADLVPVGALFVGMGDLKNARLIERFSEELQPNRQFLPAL